MTGTVEGVEHHGQIVQRPFDRRTPQAVGEVVVNRQQPAGLQQGEGLLQQRSGFRGAVGVQKIAEKHQTETRPGCERMRPEITGHRLDGLPRVRIGIEPPCGGKGLGQFQQDRPGIGTLPDQLAGQGSGTAADIQYRPLPPLTAEAPGDLGGLAAHELVGCAHVIQGAGGIFRCVRRLRRRREAAGGDLLRQPLPARLHIATVEQKIAHEIGGARHQKADCGGAVGPAPLVAANQLQARQDPQQPQQFRQPAARRAGQALRPVMPLGQAVEKPQFQCGEQRLRMPVGAGQIFQGLKIQLGRVRIVERQFHAPPISSGSPPPAPRRADALHGG